jgi:Aminoglycoside adenylyltransferase, C-terminal domain/Nucleotidyltransferase domain
MPNGDRDSLAPGRLFALGLTRGLRDCLGAGLVGVYLHGSVATGEEVPGRSDVDLIAVCEQPLSAGQRDRSCALLVASPPPPAFPAVDLGILTAGIARHPERPVRWELMVRGERAGDRLAVTDLGGYPGDLLDVEMARQRGVALIGPGPGEVFAPIPAAWVLGACAEELRVWAGRDHYEDPASGVLNACRARRYAEERVLSSKTGGGEWARSRSDSPLLIEAALAIRKGEAGVTMPDGEVNAFVRHALRRVEAAARSDPGVDDPPSHPC